MIIGDHFFARRTQHVERGDVIVFRYPCTRDRDFVERIVAVSGDSVEVRCGVLYVNGTAPPQGLRGKADYGDHQAGDSGNDSKAPADGAQSVDFPPLGDLPSGEESLERKRTASSLGWLEDWCDRWVFRAAARGEFVRSGSDAGGACDPVLHYVVPDGHVFVMGDNRWNSKDSRVWGPVAVDDIKGKAYSLWWSQTPENGVAWDRIGTRIE